MAEDCFDTTEEVPSLAVMGLRILAGTGGPAVRGCGRWIFGSMDSRLQSGRYSEERDRWLDGW